MKVTQGQLIRGIVELVWRHLSNVRYNIEHFRICWSIEMKVQSNEGFSRQVWSSRFSLVVFNRKKIFIGFDNPPLKDPLGICTFIRLFACAARLSTSSIVIVKTDKRQWLINCSHVVVFFLVFGNVARFAFRCRTTIIDDFIFYRLTRLCSINRTSYIVDR
jgi:hypothetical protein